MATQFRFDAGWSLNMYAVDHLQAFRLKLVFFILVLGLVQPLMRYWRRHRKGEPLIQAGDGWLVLEDSWFYIFMATLLWLPDFAKTQKWPAWVEDFVVPAALILTIASSGLASWRRQKIIQKGGRDNPLAGAGPKPGKVPITAEDKRMSLLMPLAMLGILFAWSGLFLLFVWLPLHILGQAHVQEAAGMSIVLMIAQLAITLRLVKRRWRIDVLSKTGVVEIAASPEAVWEKLAYAPTDHHWRPTVLAVDAIGETPESYRLWMRTFSSCPTCSLPYDPDGRNQSMSLDVTEATPHRRYRTRSRMENITGFMKGFFDFEESTYTLERLSGQQTRLTLVNDIHQPKLFAWLLFKLGNSSQQFVDTIKAAVEGSKDSSIYSKGDAMLAQVRSKPKFCGCAVPPTA
jgi:hypothetical protein